MSEWQGKPRWNGKTVDVNLVRCVLPYVRSLPFTMLLENCDDPFLIVFSSIEKLRAHMAHPLTQRILRESFGTTDYQVKQVDEPTEFCESIWGSGVRIMLDPQIISEHHTKWLEVVREGDQIKFLEPE